MEMEEKLQWLTRYNGRMIPFEIKLKKHLRQHRTQETSKAD